MCHPTEELLLRIVDSTVPPLHKIIRTKRRYNRVQSGKSRHGAKCANPAALPRLQTFMKPLDQANSSQGWPFTLQLHDSVNDGRRVGVFCDQVNLRFGF